MTPKKIRVEEDTVMPYQFEGKVTKAIEFLQSLVDRYGETIEFDWHPNYYFPYDHDPTPLFMLMTVRLETPEEVSTRLANEANREEVIRRRDLAVLAELKKKYES